ncbi:lysozyme inhibitor LprI family protein [Paraburkholderia sp. JPY419]|uniref:lysozyme inhibitor LprI family protein n=1 Tax=Paraburkholderia sp. JPY419 TaxID=667660 RepID=UPI003D229066
MTHHTKLIAAIAFWPIFSIAATVYSGGFDYKQIQSSATYFSGHSEKEIDHLCKSGEHATNDDLAQCQHREFERAKVRLDDKLKAVTARFERGDNFLKTYDEKPLAMPYFVSAQVSWMKFRDSQCYAETYMMGEAAERDIYFWGCMTDITQTRVNELAKLLKDWSVR